MAKDSLLWHRKNIYTTNLMHLPASASNSLGLLVLLTNYFPGAIGTNLL